MRIERFYKQETVFRRDDYELIASESMKQYVAPVITEFCCFIDPTRCADRLVSAFAWHPYLSGIFVTSYTYKALNTFAKGNKWCIRFLLKKKNFNFFI